MIELPKHVHRVQSRGKVYLYYQRGRGSADEGPRVRLPDDPHSSEFWAEIDRLEGRSGAGEGSFDSLIAAYKASPEFDQKAPDTQRSYLRYLTIISTAWGRLPVAGLDAGHVLELRDEFADRPATANHIVRTLSMLLTWSIPRRYRADNPCISVPKLKAGEYEPWPDAVIELARGTAPEHLIWVMETALYTGQRQRDCLASQWTDLDDGGILVKQHKTGKKLWIPLHSEYRAVLASIPRVSTFIHTTARGTPWTQDGFRASWQKAVTDRIREVKEGRFVFHGLRKVATCKLAEAGCSEHEIQAVTGMGLQTIAHYSKGAKQKTLAKAAVLKLEGRTKKERGL